MLVQGQFHPDIAVKTPSGHYHWILQPHFSQVTWENNVVSLYRAENSLRNGQNADYRAHMLDQGQGAVRDPVRYRHFWPQIWILRVENLMIWFMLPPVTFHRPSGPGASSSRPSSSGPSLPVIKSLTNSGHFASSSSVSIGKGPQKQYCS